MVDRTRNRPSVESLIDGLKKGDHSTLSKALTIAESKLASDQSICKILFDQLPDKSGKSIRLGITGPPGVGKSTFIEALGQLIIDEGKKVAVLTVDPSSSLSGGSILADKTRMSVLAKSENAFIRPTSAGSHLGGIGLNTKESIQLCEAAGFEVIIIETVGVGQNEYDAGYLVDYLLLMMVSGGGGELQGIKRGIMEMADGIVINKADADYLSASKQLKITLENVLHLFTEKESSNPVLVKLCSSVIPKGIDEIWKMIKTYINTSQSNGYFDQNRLNQEVKWFEKLILNKLEKDFLSNTEKQKVKGDLSKKIIAGELTVRHAIDLLFS